jgi:hypothetical protein
MQLLNRFFLTLACGLLLTSGDALAGGADSPLGDPPHGVAFQSDAKGTKLTGVITIELTEINPAQFTATAARGILRLRQGGQLATFYTQVENTHDCSDADVPDLNDCVRWEFNFEVEEIEAALLDSLVLGLNGILATFFRDDCGVNGDECTLAVTPKLIDETAEIFATVGSSTSLMLVADVVLAVK